MGGAAGAGGGASPAPPGGGGEAGHAAADSPGSPMATAPTAVGSSSSPMSRSSHNPSRPLAPWPQQRTRPSLRRAHVCNSPALIAVTVVPSAEIEQRDRAGELVVADAIGVPEAELARGVRPPASGPAEVEHRAGVAPDADRRGRAPRPDVDRSGRARRLGVADVLAVAVAERALAALAPAAQRGGVEQRAGRAGAGTDRGRRAARADVDGSDRTRRLVVADPIGVGVPEAAVEAEAPAAHVASSSSAQVKSPPALIAVAVRPGPRSTGPAAAGVSSSPIVRPLAYPSAPFSP